MSEQPGSAPSSRWPGLLAALWPWCAIILVFVMRPGDIDAVVSLLDHAPAW